MKKNILYVGLIIMFILAICLLKKENINEEKNKKEGSDYLKLNGVVIEKNDSYLSIQDNKNIIYTLKYETNFKLGDAISIKYLGNLNKDTEIQSISIKKITKQNNENNSKLPSNFQDNGIFQKYYNKAYNLLKKMTLDEKIAQILLVRYPDENQKEILNHYNFGGYLFYEKDLKDKTEKEVKEIISTLQSNSKIPILTAVDEEGGKVVRVSSNKNLVAEKFKSSRELYLEGGFNLIKKDTLYKSEILNNLGINLNLAPVVDVSTNEQDYIYERALGEDVHKTSIYAKTVIAASKKNNVSYALKHFPGYGNNSNTHTGIVVDSRTYDDIINNNLPPFESGIKAGAEIVLISHNIVMSLDNNNPASISKSIHNLLRNKLNFSGIIITDDLYMQAVNKIPDIYIKAILSGNDMLITTNYLDTINALKDAINNQKINESIIDKMAFRVLSWKYYKKLL